MKKNYGIMKYTRAHTKPSAKASARYLADMFDLNDTARIETIYDKELKKYTDYYCSDSVKSDDLDAIRAIFLEKQLKKHGRNRLSDKTIVDEYESDDIAGIVRTYLEQRNNYSTKVSKAYTKWRDAPENRDELYRQYSQADKDNRENCEQYDAIRNEYRKMFSEMRAKHSQQQSPTPAQPATAETVEHVQEIATQSSKDMPNTELAQSIKRNIDDGWTQNTYAEMKQHEQIGDTCDSYGNGVSADKKMAKLDRGIFGEYKNIPLAKKLQTILDEIIGQSEIRAQERGFNRPSRFSHFVKDCFLPVYRCNKPRKRPAFYIDASGSMGKKLSSGFNCKTSAIGAFLRANHRRISELRPKYYAFNGYDRALEFDIKKELPRAAGGTSVGFIANIKEKENNVVITDAQFSYADLGLIRMWATDHPKACVNWIVNDKSSLSGLETALTGLKNQKIHYINF